MTASKEMPRYKCHKEVWALKIKRIQAASGYRPTEPNEESDGGAIITPSDAGYGPFRVESDYIRKHHPEVGGYYVVYKDGYNSYSPATAFEEGYDRI